MSNRINFLPPWVETNMQPAFYDKESGSCLQQTARMYAKVNQLVRIANEQYATIAEYIAKFIQLKDFVEDYFENLDVQEEINNKLDEMTRDGSLTEIIEDYVDPFLTEFNQALTSIRQEVDSAVGATPIAVSNTADMTDENKIYVLTTDGYWYYYDGDSWERGGVYQSTAVADFSIEPYKTSFSKRSDNLIDIVNAPIITGYSNSGKIVSGNGTATTWVEVEPNTTYTVNRSVTTGRFSVFTTVDEPAVNVTTYQKEDGHTSDKLTITTNGSVHYLCVYFWNTNQSTNTLNEALQDLSVVEGNRDSVLPSYIVAISEENIADESVTPNKTTFGKQSSNLYNPKGEGIFSGYPDAGKLYSGGNAKCAYIEVEPNTNYVVRKMQSSRFSTFFLTEAPANEVDYTNRINNNSGTQIKTRSGANDHYLVVYYYRQASDTDVTEEEICNSIVICEGTDDIQSYIPYGKIVEVTTANLDDGAVTSSKLSPEIRGSLNKIGRLQSRSGIFGVEFDLTSNSTKGKRVGNAEGLFNDYVVGSDYQLNNGVNDFDEIYPWCDMRRCNVKFVDGVKVVTYDDEDDFALDGSNGEVMVEIPKFYSYRKRIGDKETWAISGEPKAEFEVEPAFIVNGEEKDYIYVSCYEASALHNNTFSSTGTVPTTAKTIAEFITDFSAKGLQSYDITIFQMLQKLVTIEFGDRNIQSYMGGVSYLPYYYTATPVELITGVGENTVDITNNDDGGRKTALWVGERIKFIPAGTPEGSEQYARIITNLEVDGTTTTITYSGSDLSGVLSVGDGFGGCPQVNGLTDDLEYHTGRTTFASGNTYENYVNPMRYRWIENLYGNMWEQIAGLRIMNLDYYISNIPNYNESISSTSLYDKVGYKAPLQDQYGEGGAGYIVTEGYDNNNHNLNLPTLCGTSNGGGADKYFADAFYSRNATSTTQYESYVGGGWDHYQMCGIFCLRCWHEVNSKGGLVGNRAIYR